MVQFDEGGEFYNQRVLPLLEKKGIRHFSTHSKPKAAIVERFNETLKNKMWKMFDHHGNKKWLEELPSLVSNVNGSNNRSIGMAPSSVNKETEVIVFAKLYAHATTTQTPKFKVGDEVHISKYTSPFHGPQTFKKGYKANFSREVFVVSGISHGDPVMYSLVDMETGDLLPGRFYEQELS